MGRFPAEQSRACHHVYDTKKKRLVKAPDHKTRLAATTLSRAYHEGKPIERTISASGDCEDLQSLLEAMKNSPAAQASLQKVVQGGPDSPPLPWHDREGKEVPPALPALPDAAREQGEQAG